MLSNKVGTFRQFSFGTQVRKSPFSDAALRWGAKGFSVYNHIYIPRDFGDPVQNFWNLVNDAILCDVGVKRQVEITSPDASRFIQYLNRQSRPQSKRNPVRRTCSVAIKQLVLVVL